MSSSYSHMAGTDSPLRPSDFDYYLDNLGGSPASIQVLDNKGNKIGSTTTDFGAAMNLALQRVTAGAKIYISSGSFTYSTATNFSRLSPAASLAGIRLEGAGNNKTFIRPSTLGLTCLDFAKVSTPLYIVQLANFKISNSLVSTAGTGINLGKEVYELNLYDVEIRDLGTNSITGTINSGFNWIRNCNFLTGPVDLTLSSGNAGVSWLMMMSNNFFKTAPNSITIASGGFLDLSHNNFYGSSKVAVSMTVNLSSNSWLIETENSFKNSGAQITPAGNDSSVVFTSNYIENGELIYNPSRSIRNVATFTGNIFKIAGVAVQLALSNLTSMRQNSVTITGNSFLNTSAGAATWLHIGDNWSNVLVRNNSVQPGNGTLGLFTGNGLDLKTVIVEGNPGYNPEGFGVATPSFPASATNIQNTKPYKVRIHMLTAGIVEAYQLTDPSGTALSINASLIAGETFELEPGAKIQFTYSVAPTWEWYGE